jgi:hypothetical protein
MTQKNFAKVVLDIADRALRTVAQKFLTLSFAAIPAVGVLTATNWLNNLEVAASAGVISVLMSFATLKVPVQLYWVDLLLRVARTFTQSLLVTWGADSFNIFHCDWPTTLLLAGATAGQALVAGIAATGVTGKVKSASLVFSSVLDEMFVSGKKVADGHRDAGVVIQTQQPAATVTSASGGAGTTANLARQYHAATPASEKDRTFKDTGRTYDASTESDRPKPRKLVRWF